MKFSIITPVRNRVKYLEETIKSVLNQSALKNDIELEFIIIDGASDDGTLEIIKKYAEHYKNIKYISEKDESMYDALQKGLAICKGDIISYINAGDLYNINAFQIADKIFSKSRNVFWITGGKYIYNENSEIVKSTVPYVYRPSLIRSGVYGRFLPFIQQESTFWRRELNNLVDLEKLKKLKFAGDYYLWSSFSKKYKLNIIQTHLGGFKMHGDNLSFKTLDDGLTYKKEVDTFRKKISLKDIFLIFLDIIPWTILKYSNEIFGFIANHYKYNFNLTDYTKRSNDNNVYCWVCDLGSNRGEGRLAQKFLDEEFPKNTNFILKSINSKIEIHKSKLEKKIPSEKNINLSFVESYIAPIFGVFWLWSKFISGKKVCYLNFLPLWNLFLIVFLPPKTILGPITGSLYKGKVYGIQSFVRKYILPFLYRINSKIIEWRSSNLIFSTELLVKYFKNKNSHRFNYILSDLKYNNYNKFKNLDLSIYYRKYDTKSNKFFEKLIEYFDGNKNYNFVYFGHMHENYSKNYLGFIENKEVNKILNDTKFSVLTEENFESIFTSECLTNHVNVFFDPQKMKKIENLKPDKKIISINYDDLNYSIETIKTNIANFEKLNFPYQTY